MHHFLQKNCSMSGIVLVALTELVFQIQGCLRQLRNTGASIRLYLHALNLPNTQERYWLNSCCVLLITLCQLSGFFIVQSGLHAREDGARVMALESWQGNRDSTHFEALSRSFSSHGRKPRVPSTCASDLRQILREPLRIQGYSGVGRGLSGHH